MNKFLLTKKVIKSKNAEGYIDTVIGVLCIMLVIAFAISLFPVFTEKQQLDVFATEIVRQAEINGSTDVDERINKMKEQTGLEPQITWNCDYFDGNRVQLNDDIEVVLTTKVDIGFFVFGSFPVEIQAKATGKSEVYYK